MKKYKLDSFYKDLEQLPVSLNEKQVCQFMKYYELMIEWNRVINLTAITDFDEVCKKHFIDSLSIVKAYDVSSVETLIDIGTGAGFPGIPLKIAFPDLKVTLLDSLNKRVNFLNAVIDELELKNIDTLHGRAEDYAGKGKLREQYDVCVSRAVANLSTLCEYCIPYVKVGGHFISYKSEKIADEIVTAKKAISILGGKLKNQVEFMIPNSDIYRKLVVIYKNKKTPASYPRKAGVPSKNPIA